MEQIKTLAGLELEYYFALNAFYVTEKTWK